MKKSRILKTFLGIMTSIVVISGTILVNPINVQAAHDIKATVTGTVQKGTDGSTLYLNTAQGEMIIKLDSDTEASCKLLLPGSTVYVGVYYGSDAYMHAATISSTNNTPVDTSGYKISTVNGYITADPISNGIMYVKVGDDVMHLKLDSSTDYSGCGILYAGKNVNIDVYRGDDAYMHAKSFRDGSGSSAAVSYTAGASSSAPANTTPVTGTISAKSKAGMLVLDSKDGEYQLKLDSNTNYSNGYLLAVGKKIIAYVYRGDDAYMHVASVVRTGNLSATSSGSTTMTFTGSIDSSSTDSTLVLNTSGGVMKIRLDANTQYNGSTPLYSGTKVSVTSVNCSDEYWHATSISVQ